MTQKFSTADVFVVVLRHNDRWSFDTGAPDEIFTTREAADQHAAEANAAIEGMPLYRQGKSRQGKSGFYVESLADRLATIRDECHSEGEQDGRSDD